MSSAIRMVGDVALQRALLEMEQSSANRVMKPALREGAKIVRTKAKQNVEPHKRSGLLRKAISFRVGVSRKTREAYGRIYVKNKRSEWGGKTVNPAKYAHLVEFGTSHSRAFPFMRTALAQTRGPVGAAITREADVALAKLAGNLRRKHNTMMAARLASAGGVL